MHLRTPIYILALCATTGTSTQVVEVQWSNTTYGPDGPWHAATVYVGFNGTAGQRIDLYPGGNGVTEVFLPGYCENSGVPAGQCGALQAGFYNPNISKTAIPYFNQSYHVTEIIDLSVNESLGPGQIFYDTVYFTNDQQFNAQTGLPDVHVKNNLVVGLPYGQDFYRTGLVTAPTLGMLDIGGLDDAGFTNSSVTTSGLYETGITSSASMALHVGSVNMKIPPSMYYGGYDAARVVGDVLTSTGPTVSRHADIFSIQLNDIGIGTAEGASPFPEYNRTGILAQGNATLASGLILPLQPQTPWLGLPQSVCAAITQDLPIIFDGAIGLYLWNTSDPRYTQIVTSPSYLSFYFQSTSSSAQISINVPFSLLNLTLEPPVLVPEPTLYFPCSPTDTYWYLGRAFLQAAFISTNWKPKNPPGSFWLAQAPGPNLPAANLTAIQNDDLILPNNNVDWASTWKGHWTPLTGSEVGFNGTQPNGQQIGGSSGGLSSGAQAGLGVGIALAVILLCLIGAFFYMRRRKQKQRSAAEEAAVAAAKQDNSASSDGRKPSKAELAAWERDEKHQLHGDSQRAEMTGDGQRVELDDALGGAANPAEALYETAPQLHELPEDREYYKGMPVRVAGDPSQRIEIE